MLETLATPQKTPSRGRWSRPRAAPILRDATVLGAFGERGSGKSALAAKFGIQRVRKRQPVFYWPEKFRLEGASHISIEEIIEMPEYLRRAFLILDEIQTLMPSARSISTANLTLTGVFQQLRKLEVDVVFTSNSPQKIDPGVAPHTDYHAFCRLFKDPVCYRSGRGRHKWNCRDVVMARWIDTNGRWGGSISNSAHRTQAEFVLAYPIRRVYGRYDTQAVASVAESFSITADSVRAGQKDVKQGISTNDLTDILIEQVIPELARKKITTITAAPFARFLGQQIQNAPDHPGTAVDISAQHLGRILRQIGLVSVRGGKWRLPAEDDLEDFKAGLWAG